MSLPTATERERGMRRQTEVSGGETDRKEWTDGARSVEGWRRRITDADGRQTAESEWLSQPASHQTLYNLQKV